MMAQSRAGTWRLGIAIAAWAICTSSLAQGVADPTRPAGIAHEAAEPVYAGPVLQSTIVAPNLKRAVISGRTYSIGDKLGAGVIVDIRSYEVVLDQGGRETRLRIVPRLMKDARSEN